MNCEWKLIAVVHSFTVAVVRTYEIYEQHNYYKIVDLYIFMENLKVLFNNVNSRNKQKYTKYPDNHKSSS